MLNILRQRNDAELRVISSPERGRQAAPKPLENSILPQEPSLPLHHPAFDHHHHLPEVSTVEIPTEPILFLPPLLSPLPNSTPQPPPATEFDPARSLEPPSLPTRLPSIDPASLSLHHSLHFIRPTSQAYASLPYPQAFNWASIHLPLSTDREWYCVVFRSKRNKGSQSLSLYEADRRAHEEAISNGGLIMYWYGVPVPDFDASGAPNAAAGMNLATCIWQSRAHAIAAVQGPHHMRAMKEAAQAYEVYDLERWILRKTAGESQISLEPWVSGPVGW